jgi:hypothetical protein
MATEVRGMLVRWHLSYDFAERTTWLALAVGLAVACLVYVVLTRLRKWRRLVPIANGEIPWEDLLEMSRARHRELAASDPLAEENLPPDELLALLLSRLPAKRRHSRQVPSEDREYLASGGAERRSSHRRWGNPIEVSLSSKLWPNGLHGLVINRSAGGFAIFVDEKIEPTTIVSVRPLDAPRYIKKVQIEVKYCRRICSSFLIGCQANTELPWDILVWFG